MKKSIFGAICLSFALGLAVSTSAQILPEGLMIYLPFDEGKGDVAQDMSGNGYEGILSGGAKFTNDGTVNAGVELVGGSSVVSVADFDLSPIGEHNQITIGAWFKSTNHSGWDGVVSIEIPGGDCCEYRLLLSNANPPVPFWDMGHHTDRTGTFKFDLDTWYQYVITYDGADAHIYVDGTEVDGSNEGIDLPTDPGTLMIGVGESVGTHAMEGGIIDEVFVTNREMDQAEIQSIMDKGVAQAVDPRNKLAIRWAVVKMRY